MIGYLERKNLNKVVGALIKEYGAEDFLLLVLGVLQVTRRKPTCKMDIIRGDLCRRIKEIGTFGQDQLLDDEQVKDNNNLDHLKATIASLMEEHSIKDFLVSVIAVLESTPLKAFDKMKKIGADLWRVLDENWESGPNGKLKLINEHLLDVSDVKDEWID